MGSGVGCVMGEASLATSTSRDFPCPFPFRGALIGSSSPSSSTSRALGLPLREDEAGSFSLASSPSRAFPFPLLEDVVGSFSASFACPASLSYYTCLMSYYM